VAWALAESAADVLVLDKGRIGSGASGIAGGIVRNYYRAEAITELVRLSVEMFEEDPEAYGFRQVGYLAAVPEPRSMTSSRSASSTSESGTGPSWSREPRPAAST
jgi:glycine/D-amino acid oxidase-like deaminating enzyme